MLYNEIFYYLLCSCLNFIFKKICAKTFSANQIAEFFNQLHLLNKSMKQPDFLLVDTNSHTIKVDQKMVKNGCGQSGHGTLKGISKMNKWNEQFFLQIQKRWKLFQWFLGGCGQEWVRPFSSWDPKTCCILRMTLWI